MAQLSLQKKKFIKDGIIIDSKEEESNYRAVDKEGLAAFWIKRSQTMSKTIGKTLKIFF